MSESRRRKCIVCGDSCEDKPWLVVNRYGIGTGKASCLISVLDDESTYLWERDEDGDLIVSGVLLCWPACAKAYIDGKMFEVDTEINKRRARDDDE